MEKREGEISKGLQDRGSEEKAELLGIKNVSKPCRFRSLSHTEKAVVPYNSDIKLLFTLHGCPSCSLGSSVSSDFPSLVPCTPSMYHSSLSLLSL